MSEAEELEWGHTPWDEMSHDELLREVQRMYAVVVELSSIVKMSRAVDQYRAGMDMESEEPPNPYWGKEGVGGNALEMARQVLEPLHQKYTSSNMYRAFFRYAHDLLFEKNGFTMISSDWVVCPKCGAMYGDRQGTLIGKPCHDGNTPFGKRGCDGAFRKLEWDDLKPGRWDGA